MVDLPRSLPPSDAERLAVLRQTTFPGGVSGESRNMGPGDNHGGRGGGTGVGGGNDDDFDGCRHFSEYLKEAGDEPVSPYTLTYDPADDPYWPQVFAGDALQRSGVDYDISGQTISILAPMRLRLADTLRADYHYLDGVPTAPTEAVIPGPPGTAPISEDSGGGAAISSSKTVFLPADIVAGDGILVIGITRTESYTGITGLSGFTGPADEIVYNPAGPSEWQHVRLWYKVADGSEAGAEVRITTTGGAHWLSLHWVVYGQATPTLIGSSSAADGTAFTSAAGAPTDGWTVYVIGHGYSGITAANPDLVSDYPAAGVQGKVAVFHAADTNAAEDFTSGGDYGWSSHVLSLEG